MEGCLAAQLKFTDGSVFMPFNFDTVKSKPMYYKMRDGKTGLILDSEIFIAVHYYQWLNKLSIDSLNNSASSRISQITR